jgi:hypothetical protein
MIASLRFNKIKYLQTIGAQTRETHAAPFNEDLGCGLVDILFEEFPGTIPIGNEKDSFAISGPRRGQTLVCVQGQAARGLPTVVVRIGFGDKHLTRCVAPRYNKPLSIRRGAQSTDPSLTLGYPLRRGSGLPFALVNRNRVNARIFTFAHWMVGEENTSVRSPTQGRPQPRIILQHNL